MTRTVRRSAFALVMLLTPALHAQDPSPSPRAGFEARIIKSLEHVIDVGAPMFNSGDQIGCLRLYEGALLAVTPLLDHRADLHKSVQDKVVRARQPGGTTLERAFALRAAIDEIRSTLHKDQPRTLWARLGGKEAVEKVVRDFVAVAGSDPKVDFTRGGKFPIQPFPVGKLEQLLVAFISDATGGPIKYDGRDMVVTHTGMNITEEQFDAAAGHLVETLKKYNVPQKEIDELVAIVGKTKKDIVGK